MEDDSLRGDAVPGNGAQQQAGHASEAAQKARRELPVAPQWFEVAEIADGVFRITEPYVHPYVRSNTWLIRGSHAHLLIDSGLGVGRLPDELSEYLDRPVIAMATHGHFDHFGGLAEFSVRAAHRDDGEVIEAAGDYITLAANTYPAALVDEFDAAGLPVPDLLIDALPHEGFDLHSFRTPAATITRWLADGDVLDLGDRSFEVLHAPGHSPGSICLWDAGSGTLVSGDVIVDGEPLLDELPRSSPADFAASLRRLREVPFDTVLAGHGPLFGRGRAQEIIADYLATRGR